MLCASLLNERPQLLLCLSELRRLPQWCFVHNCVWAKKRVAFERVKIFRLQFWLNVGEDCLRGKDLAILHNKYRLCTKNFEKKCFTTILHARLSNFAVPSIWWVVLMCLLRLLRKTEGLTRQSKFRIDTVRMYAHQQNFSRRFHTKKNWEPYLTAKRRVSAETVLSNMPWSAQTRFLSTTYCIKYNNNVYFHSRRMIGTCITKQCSLIFWL